MCPNPIPYDGVTVESADGAVTNADARGINRWIGIDLLESETGMAMIQNEEVICGIGLSLYLCRKLCQ